MWKNLCNRTGCCGINCGEVFHLWKKMWITFFLWITLWKDGVNKDNYPKNAKNSGPFPSERTAVVTFIRNLKPIRQENTFVPSDHVPGSTHPQLPGPGAVGPWRGPGQSPGGVKGQSPGGVNGQRPSRGPGQSPGGVKGQRPSRGPGQSPGGVKGQSPDLTPAPPRTAGTARPR